MPTSLPRPSSPRIAPLTLEECDEQQRELLESAGGRGALNIFRTLVHNPGLFRRWWPFGGKLLQGGKLAPRDRELVILRSAWLCQSAYEWGQHVAIARTAGLTDDEIERVAAGPEAEGWSTDDAVLLRGADELIGDRCITDQTWAALAARLTVEQLIELPMLAGHYALLAGTLNSLGVQPEGAAPPLGKTVLASSSRDDSSRSDPREEQ